MQMILKQLSLDVWRDEYSYAFLELNNFGIKNAILSYNESFVLCGEKFSGKKHLIFEIIKKKKIECYFANNMSDMEIIALYDLAKINNKIICWIVDGDFNIFVKDVQSRFNALYCFMLKPLNRVAFEQLFVHRLNVVGVVLTEKQINYCCDRLNISYVSLENFINFIKGRENINFKDLRLFFEIYFAN